LGKAFSSPACSRYFALIDDVGGSEPGPGMLHLEQVECYSPAP
jgi:hypothetical protein